MLYVEEGDGPLVRNCIKPGKHTILFGFNYDGGGLSKGGNGTLGVDSKTVATVRSSSSPGS
jgi:hypothetical protein